MAERNNPSGESNQGAASRTFSVYVHIPFCRAKCPYCSFASEPLAGGAKLKPYLAALESEIELMAPRAPWRDGRIATVYVGGGTPSLVAPPDLARLLATLDDSFGIDAGAEITVEANPESASAAWLEGVRAAGFNRLSLGAQSFDDADLTRLGRLHTAAQAETANAGAVRAGFRNINLDLIAAVPGQSPATWRASLDRALSLGPRHLSVYSLTLEEGRALADGAGVIDEESDLELFLLTMDHLAKCGFLHYEISSYALPGFQCRHNLAYWTGATYLGIGVGAHSYDGRRRWWNLARVDPYLQAVRSGTPPLADRESPTPEQRELETVLLGLRLTEGLDLRRMSAEVGRRRAESIRDAARPLESAGLVRLAGNRLRLTPAGLPLADEITAELVRERPAGKALQAS